MVPVACSAVLDTGIKRERLIPLVKKFMGILKSAVWYQAVFWDLWLTQVYKWSVPKDKLYTDSGCVMRPKMLFFASTRVHSWVLKTAAQLARSFNMHCVHALLFLQFPLITWNNISDDLLGFEIHLKILIQIWNILDWAASLNFFWKMGSCSDWRSFWSSEITLHFFKRHLACFRLYYTWFLQ